MKLSVFEAGAVPNVAPPQTEAFQKALDTVFEAGGGTVTVPDGEYHIGAIRIRSNTTLYLCSGARLIGSRDPMDYYVLQNDTLEPLPEEMRTEKMFERGKVGEERDFSFLLPGGRWSNGLIRACCADNIAIIAEDGATIDGSDCYDELGEEKYRGPHGISIHHCKNIKLSGYTIQNTGNWAHIIFNSENVSCERITILGGHDGIHCRGCRNIEINHCEIYTGDDCIAGFANINTHISDCVLNTACSGLRLGGTSILCENCRFYGPAKYFFRGSLSLEEKKNGAKANVPHRINMLSVFTYLADLSFPIPVQPGNIIIKNCTADNVDRLLHYNFSGNERWQCGRPLASLTVENVTATNISMPITLYGSKDTPLGFCMKNSKIEFKETDDNAPSPVFRVAYFERIQLKNVDIEKASDGDLIRSWSPLGTTSFENVSYHVPSEEWTEIADEPFICKSI